MFGQNNPVTNENPQDKSEFSDLKKKRDEYNLEIRKQKREDILGRKRNKNLEMEQKLREGYVVKYNLVEDPELRECVEQWLKRPFEITELFHVIEAASSSDLFQQHYGVIGLRKLLATGQQQTIQSVIDANMIPKLITYVRNAKEPQLQLEAAWALTNVAAGTTQQTQSIIDKGGIESFIELLSSERCEVAEQAIWAIGNIAGDSNLFRDKILACGGLKPLLRIIETTSNKIIVKHGTWAVSNLCRGKPLPPLDAVDIAIPTLCKVLIMETDPDVLMDAAWAICYLSREDDRIEPIVKSGAVPKLVQLLDTKILQLLVPCLRSIGNIVMGSFEEVTVLLHEEKFLPLLFQIIEQKKKVLKKEACWILSNVVAQGPEVSEMVLGNLHYFKILLEIATSDLPEVQREAIWVFLNATQKGSLAQVAKMVENGLLECLVFLLESKDAEVLDVVLRTIWQILNWGAIFARENNCEENPFLLELDNKGGVTLIEKLQSHPNNDVYMKALRILEEYFELETPF